MRKLLAVAVVLCAVSLSQAQTAPQKYVLKATPKTVVWGYYDAAAPPVLRIKSGDSVEFETLITSSPQRLEGAGLPPDQVQQNLRDIYREVTNKGPGGHILDGPVYIDGAEPGDTLEVRIQKIGLEIPYAYNGFSPGPLLPAGTRTASSRTSLCARSEGGSLRLPLAGAAIVCLPGRAASECSRPQDL